MQLMCTAPIRDVFKKNYRCAPTMTDFCNCVPSLRSYPKPGPVLWDKGFLFFFLLFSFFFFSFLHVASETDCCSLYDNVYSPNYPNATANLFNLRIPSNPDVQLAI